MWIFNNVFSQSLTCKLYRATRILVTNSDREIITELIGPGALRRISPGLYPRLPKLLPGLKSKRVWGSAH